MSTTQHADIRTRTTCKVNCNLIPEFVRLIATEYESLSEMSDDGLSNSGLEYFFFQACANRVVDLSSDLPLGAVALLPVADVVDDLYAVAIGVGAPDIYVAGRGLAIRCREDEWDIMFSCEDAEGIVEAILTDITGEVNRLLPAARVFLAVRREDLHRCLNDVTGEANSLLTPFRAMTKATTTPAEGRG